MCTVLLPPGGYPIAVNKYIISYIIFRPQNWLRLAMRFSLSPRTFISYFKFGHDHFIPHYFPLTICIILFSASHTAGKPLLNAKGKRKIILPRASLWGQEKCLPLVTDFVLCSSYSISRRFRYIAKLRCVSSYSRVI